MSASVGSSVVLVSTLGHRDLEVDGERIPEGQFRSETERLRDALTADRQGTLARLRCPILDSVIAWVIERHTAPHGRKPHLTVYLVATDQSDPAYRETDTVHAAALAREWIQARFGAGNRATASLSVKQWTYTGNPAAFDDTLRYFRTLIAHRAFPELDPDTTLYVNVTSGTPGLVFGLLAGLAPVLDERAVVLYKGPHDPRPTPTRLIPELRRARLLDEVERWLKESDFSAAARLLDSVEDMAPVARLAYAVVHRLDFDFARALRDLDDVIQSASGEMRRLAQQLQRELNELLRRVDALSEATTAMPEQYPPLLRELYVNTCLTWEAGRYADFLARAFRLEEAALRWAVEHVLRLPTGSAKSPRGAALPAFIEGIEGDPELLAHVQVPYEGRELDYRRAPTRDLLRHLLAAPSLRGCRIAQQVSMVSGHLSRLSGLRNASIVAHGFRGVSREAIVEAYGGEPLDDLRALAEAAGIDPADNPFAAARQALLEAVSRAQAQG